MDKVQLYKDEAGEYRWKRVAPNGRTISDSSEGYTRAGDAREAAIRANGTMVIYEEPEEVIAEDNSS